MHDIDEPGDGWQFIDRLAARRQRDIHDVFAMETSGVNFAALQANVLAEEAKRRSKPKPPRLCIGGPGGALCD